jgi:hypothetical protein
MRFAGCATMRMLTRARRTPINTRLGQLKLRKVRRSPPQQEQH